MAWKLAILLPWRVQLMLSSLISPRLARPLSVASALACAMRRHDTNSFWSSPSGWA